MMNTKPNKPYVKRFDDNGKLLNPITKDGPYEHNHPKKSKKKIRVGGNNRKKTRGRS